MSQSSRKIVAVPDRAPEPLSGPDLLDLSLIQEDPHQPRQYFDQTALLELCETISLRGVKTPISVRPHPSLEGHYLINHGARRYRASLLAGLTHIPAFVDGDYTLADQVVENLHRDALSAREIADFIGRELAAGKRKSEIGRSIGKSPAFITQHVALLDLPESLAEIFNSARCQDVTVINDLLSAYKKHPEDVDRFLQDADEEITRGQVRMFKGFLAQRRSGGDAGLFDPATDYGAGIPEKPVHRPVRLAHVCVGFGSRQGKLLLDRSPLSEDSAWVMFTDGEVEALPLQALNLLRIECP